jgi:hypothetical protein
MHAFGDRDVGVCHRCHQPFKPKIKHPPPAGDVEERQDVHTVQDDGHPRAPTCHPPDDPRLRLVGVHHIRRDPAHGPGERAQGRKVGRRADLTVQLRLVQEPCALGCTGQRRRIDGPPVDDPDVMAPRDLAAAGGECVFLRSACQHGRHHMNHAQRPVRGRAQFAGKGPEHQRKPGRLRDQMVRAARSATAGSEGR